MPVAYQNWIERSDLKQNQDRVYLFGDNLLRIGMGGQAKSMRGEPNALGVATKFSPGMNPQDMWIETDEHDHEKFIVYLEIDLQPVEKHLKAGSIVVIPSDGLGTGLSKLPENAPITNDWLHNKLFVEYPETYGVVDLNALDEENQDG
jgi:hypothetical protein